MAIKWSLDVTYAICDCHSTGSYKKDEDMPKRTLSQALEAAKAKVMRLEEKRRKDETRQKIVVGGWAISRALKSAEFAKVVLSELRAEEFREQDRTLLEAFCERLQEIA